MKTNRTLAAKRVVSCCPERGCVVLDQPQHLAKTWGSGIFHALRLVFDTAALLLTVANTSLLLLCPASAHAQGGVPLWTNRYPAGLANAIAVDSNGNVFVTGGSSTIKYSNAGVPLWTNLNGTAYGSMALDSNGNLLVAGGATIKYSNAGESLWTNHHDAWGNGGNAMAVDGAGNVFVAGYSSALDGFTDYSTVAYSYLGVPLWTNRYHTPGAYNYPQAVTADLDGNVFVTGYSVPTNIDGSAVTIKYSPAGVPLWTKSLYGAAGYAMTTDRSGNVLVTGVGGGNHSYATFKYSNAGTPLWTRLYKGPANYEDTAIAIAVDSSGDVFVTGSSHGGVLGSDTNPANSDFATIKYSSAGAQLWIRRYNGEANGNDGAVALALDRDGNVFVTGISSDGTNSDFLTLAYSNDGVPLWTNRFTGQSNWDQAAAIAVDNSGNVFVTGTSFSLNGNDSEYVTIKYSSSIPPPVLLDFQRLNNELVLSWTNASFNLQTAPALTGTFTNLPGATSPYSNTTSGAQQFFRLKGD